MSTHDFMLKGWLVEVARGRISRGRKTAHLEPQVMKVLAFLAENHGTVVNKNRLIEALWQNSYVSDAALTRCIFEIRKVFGDDPKNPQLIETLPRIGYRLIEAPSPINAHWTKRPAIAFATAAALTITIIFSYLNLEADEVRTLILSDISIDSFAVDDTAIIAEVLALELRKSLPFLENVDISFPDDELQPAAPNDSRKQKGSYQFDSALRTNSLGTRYDVSLIAAHTEKIVWEKSYDVINGDVFSISEDLIQQLAERLNVHPVAEFADFRSGVLTNNALAYDAYNKGFAHYEKYTYLYNENAIALFEKAVAYDPTFGLAHARLADSLAQQIRYGTGDRLSDAREAAMKALELEPLKPQSHNAHGVILSLSGDDEAALLAFRRAYTLIPTHWQSAFNAAEVHKTRLEFGKAQALYIQTIKHNPGHLVAMGHLGFLSLRMGDTGRARKWLGKVLQQAPMESYATAQLATLAMVIGNTGEAIEKCERVHYFFPTHRACLHILGTSHLINGDMTTSKQWFDYVRENFDENRYAELGIAQIMFSQERVGGAHELIKSVLQRTQRNIQNGDNAWEEYWILAACHSLLGNESQALTALESSAENGRRFSLWDSAEPLFASLHGEQRFDRYLELTSIDRP